MAQLITESVDHPTHPSHASVYAYSPSCLFLRFPQDLKPCDSTIDLDAFLLSQYREMYPDLQVKRVELQDRRSEPNIHLRSSGMAALASVHVISRSPS